jgi:enoyl-CoA hydratase/carnithine racemase
MTITLNRVDKKNSITAAMYGAMADALVQAEADPAIRAVVLQGHETVFSAGNDIGDFLNQPPATANRRCTAFCTASPAFPKPLIAAVCGPAVGVGTTMLFHCDLVYAGDNAAFSMPFVNLGLCPEAASSLLVPQMLGYHRAAEACCWASPSSPRRRSRSAWSTASCRRPKPMASRRRRRASWPPSRSAR